MNLPNKLTLSRVALTIAFLTALFMHGTAPKCWAFIFFLLACVTDFLDGYIAKHNNQVTDFGKLMDPVADKVLVLAAFISFVELNIIPAWMVIVIILREVLMTGIRVVALTKGRVLAADGGGKHKTVSQLVTIGVILLYTILSSGGGGMLGFWTDEADANFRKTIMALMYITVILTVISGSVYMFKNRGAYLNEKTRKID